MSYLDDTPSCSLLSSALYHPLVASLAVLKSKTQPAPNFIAERVYEQHPYSSLTCRASEPVPRTPKSSARNGKANRSIEHAQFRSQESFLELSACAGEVLAHSDFPAI